MDIADLGDAETIKGIGQTLQTDIDSPGLQIVRFYEERVGSRQSGQAKYSTRQKLPSSEPFFAHLIILAGVHDEAPTRRSVN